MRVIVLDIDVLWKWKGILEVFTKTSPHFFRCLPRTKRYCLSSHREDRYILQADDGCIDIQLTTNIKGYVLLAGFQPAVIQELGKIS